MRDGVSSVGWFIERAEMTARLVDVQYHILYEPGRYRRGQPSVDGSAQVRGGYERTTENTLLDRAGKGAEMLIMHLCIQVIRFSMTEVQAGCARSAAPARVPTRMKRAADGKFSSGCATTLLRNFKHGLHAYLNDMLQMCGSIGEDIARSYFYYAVWHEPISFAACNGIHYDGPVSESYNEVRLRPIHDETQSCLSFRLLTILRPGTSYRDAFGTGFTSSIFFRSTTLEDRSRVGRAGA